MNDLFGNTSSFKYLRETTRSLLVIAFVYGIQELLRIQFFRCPCTNYALYSFIILAAPSVFLLGVGFASSDGYWKIVFKRKGINNYKIRVNYCLKSLPSLFEPFLPAVAFIVFAFMRGEYYACAKVGGQVLTCVPEGRVEPIMTSKALAVRAKFYTQSQLLGCGILFGVTIFTVGIFFIRNCCFENDIMPDNEEYRVMENQVLSALFRDKLMKTLENELKRDVEEAFDGQGYPDAESVFKQARDQIHNKRSLKKVGVFSRLTFREDDDWSPRVADSSF